MDLELRAHVLSISYVKREAGSPCCNLAFRSTCTPTSKKEREGGESKGERKGGERVCERHSKKERWRSESEGAREKECERERERARAHT